MTFWAPKIIPQHLTLNKSDNVSTLIQKGSKNGAPLRCFFRIGSDIQTGVSHGMITLDAHLLYLFKNDFITAEEALSKSQIPESMRTKLIEAGADLPS